jgi:hypothetical protein
MFIDPQDYDFSELDTKITLVEQDMRGLTEDEQDPDLLRRAERWITRRGYFLTLILIFVWPILSVPAGVFSKSYFAFWVLVAIAWGFGAALIITILPLVESANEINMVLSGIWAVITGNPIDRPDLAEAEEAEKADAKEVADNDEAGPAKDEEEIIAGATFEEEA